MANEPRTSESITRNMLFRVHSAKPSSQSNRVVIFVHGFTGTWKDTWQHEKAKESFPVMLANDPSLDDEVWGFQYVTKSLFPPAIENVSVQLKATINLHLKGKNIVFVTHSMGGLVAMHCILTLLEEGKSDTVSGLLLYGCPMTGVEWARYIRVALKTASLKVPVLGLIVSILQANKQISAMESGSALIDQLNGKWIVRALNGGSPDLTTAQRAWFPVRVVSATDDWVVKQSSAQGLYSKSDWIDSPYDHRSMVKPEDRTDFSYQIAQGFLKESRNWLNPKALLKLRTQIDSIWKFHQGKPISGWRFELFFDSDQFREPIGFGLPNFYAFKVVECSYRRPILAESVRFGFAMGNLTTGKLWNDNFVFLHRIRFGALAKAVAGPLIEQLLTVLKNGSDAWDKLFDEVSIRIQDPKGLWHSLIPADFESHNDALIRNFKLPREAVNMVGQEAIVDVTFRSIIPAAIRSYTVEFPWLCDGFVTTITVLGDPAFLITGQNMPGNPQVKQKSEHQQGKVECSSDDLILPDSTIRFEWHYTAHRG